MRHVQAFMWRRADKSINLGLILEGYSSYGDFVMCGHLIRRNLYVKKAVSSNDGMKYHIDIIMNQEE